MGQCIGQIRSRVLRIAEPPHEKGDHKQQQGLYEIREDHAAKSVDQHVETGSADGGQGRVMAGETEYPGKLVDDQLGKG